MSTYRATIQERGNGFAGPGEYVSDGVGMIYRIVSTSGTIHTGQPGEPNYIYAEVEDADWDDVDDDSEPYCSVVIEDEEDAEDEQVRLAHASAALDAAGYDTVSTVLGTIYVRGLTEGQIAAVEGVVAPHGCRARWRDDDIFVDAAP